MIKKSSLALEPVEVGFKARLWEEKGALPKTSFILHTAMPKFSSRQYSHLSVAPNFRLLLQNTLSDNWALGYNARLEWDGDSTVPTYTYTFAPGFTINKKWAGYFKVFGFINKEKTPQHSVDVSLYYFPNNNIKFDISASFGLTKTLLIFMLLLMGLFVSEGKDLEISNHNRDKYEVAVGQDV